MTKEKKTVVTSLIQPLVVGIPETAAMFGVSRKTIWRMLSDGEIESVTIGQRRKIPLREIERYLAANTIPVRRAS